jgi:hypothetical protein
MGPCFPQASEATPFFERLSDDAEYVGWRFFQLELITLYRSPTSPPRYAKKSEGAERVAPG